MVGASLQDFLGALWDAAVYHSFADRFRFSRFRVWFWKRLRPSKWALTHQINLGSGPNLVAGMCNVDLRGPVDLRFNLLNRFPLPTGVVQFIQCEHTLEHFVLKDVRHILRESHRVLAPGGCLRVSVPDVFMTTERDDAEGVERLNQLYFAHAHRSLYTPALMERLLREAGFGETSRVNEQTVRWAPLETVRRAQVRAGGSVIVEAQKAG